MILAVEEPLDYTINNANVLKQKVHFATNEVYRQDWWNDNIPHRPLISRRFLASHKSDGERNGYTNTVNTCGLVSDSIRKMEQIIRLQQSVGLLTFMIVFLREIFRRSCPYCSACPFLFLTGPE